MNTQNLTDANLDVEFLKSWIQPQHLTPEAIENCREAFQSYPPHIVRLSAFLREDIVEKLGQLMAEDADFHRVRHLYSQLNRNVSEAEFVEAPEEDRLLQMSQMSQLRLKAGAKPGLNLLAFVQFQQFFFDPRFAAFLRAMTGLDLVKPSTFLANSLQVGDFIRSHNDVHHESYLRRLGFILYLTPDWKPEYGGALGITSHQGENSQWEVEYNSFAFFDVLGHGSHEVKPVLPAAPRCRISFNGWFCGVEPA